MQSFSDDEYDDEVLPLSPKINRNEKQIKSAISNCSGFNFEINYDNYQNQKAVLDTGNQLAKVAKKLQQQQVELAKVFNRVREIHFTTNSIHNDMKQLFEKQQLQYKEILQMKKQREAQEQKTE